ncbi:hypothetical protein [Burkholderia sp. Ac-20365]|uniref:hypothetical protein n=1 Tax=Burkholderia sp. Ac-20365 TaxID=2703897 RepID=UPI00197C831A|nr:hypothetical protein [Burkholderia sp. Ac-20365]MBN3759509.1 hypothetical protein [Burkholderia sp. Ac-20365]
MTLRSVRPVLLAVCAASVAALASCGGSACIGFDGCVGATPAPNVALAGTAATGKALASANVNVSCAQGSGATLSDGGGRYSLSFNATLPCMITVTASGVTLHSLAFAGGTFNTTPETELMIVYLAAQLGTSASGLVANFASNTQFQQALANQSNVLNAQSAVVTNLQQHYALTLSTPAFLTTAFVVGQAGVDSDLEALAKAGAIDANGMPDPAAIALLSQAGLAQPIAKTAATSSGSM